MGRHKEYKDIDFTKLKNVGMNEYEAGEIIEKFGYRTFQDMENCGRIVKTRINVEKGLGIYRLNQ